MFSSKTETDKSLEWLKRKNLLTLAKSHSKELEKTFNECLNATNEQVLVIGDRGYRNQRISALLSASYYFAAKKEGRKPILILQKPKLVGEIADKMVTDVLSALPEKSIIITALSHKLGRLNKESGKSFRKFCKTNKHKFVSCGGLANLTTEQFSYVAESINIDYKELQKKHANLKKILSKAKKIQITTDKGTNLTLDVTGIVAHSSDGKYTLPGVGGNLPAGEVYIAPKNANGIVIVDGSSKRRGGTTLIKEPITLIIENGQVIKIEGGFEANLLQKTVDWAKKRAKKPENITRLAEFGIGLNPKAKIVGATIIDEKTIGTAHVALGSNYWFGGNIFTIIHLDQVFRNPKIYVDNKELLIE
ncbi:aminopeptidase [Nanoarchaeota archaeon]